MNLFNLSDTYLIGSCRYIGLRVQTASPLGSLMLRKDRVYVLDVTSGMAHILVLTGYRSLLMGVENCHNMAGPL